MLPEFQVAARRPANFGLGTKSLRTGLDLVSQSLLRLSVLGRVGELISKQHRVSSRHQDGFQLAGTGLS